MIVHLQKDLSHACKEAASAMSDKTGTQYARASHKWPSASLAVICALKPLGVAENKADRR